MNARSLVLSLGLLPLAAAASDPLSEAFRNPPPEARPHTWWHWMNSNVSKAGITADLEAMARVGLGGVQLFDAGLLVPKGKVAFDTPEWYDHIAFAAHEAERLGLSFGLSNCSGWSSTGGPWITPEYGMKFVTNVTAEVCGPKRATIALPRPKKDFGFYRGIAVVAFPTPRGRAAIPAVDRRVFRRRGLPEEAVDVAPMHPDEFGPEACVDLGSVRILDVRPDADGNVTWDVPEGKWTVIRFGYVCNGMTNHPGSSGGVGLECDKLDAKALDLHFDSYLMKVRRAIGDCKAFDNILIDSYEVNAQNWTHGFEKAFRARKGYDILPYLPVLAGYPIDSVARTDAFLSDFRRVIADLFAENYAGRMAARCREIGVQFACEPYGTSPSDDLQYGAMCDIPMCEFWTRRMDGVSMVTRWGHRWRGNARTVASVAHFWGKPTVGAEAFTSYSTSTSGSWLGLPALMKAQGDMILADGVNRMYFHRYVHQPWTDPTRYPGLSLGFYGAHFERTQTWWENGFRAYVGYLTRAQSLLRRGTYVADVLMDEGDAAPSYGDRGVIPEGWRGDHCSQSGRAKLRREGDLWVSPGGMRYRLLAHPGEDVARRLGEIGCAKDFTCSDPRVNWIHRRDGTDEIYFVATPFETAGTVTCSFRDAGGEPELWDPETGTIRRTTCRRVNGRAEVDLSFDPAGSVFVVFRRTPTEGAEPMRAYESARMVAVEGPWQVAFTAPGETTPTVTATFDGLVDWTSRPEDAIRYFSGTATYVRRVTVARPQPGERVFLDLGDVRDIAEVEVNGRALPVLWKRPYRTDVTDALTDGEVELKVKVTNRWPNRMIGDERLCAEDAEWQEDRWWRLKLLKSVPDWVEAGLPSPTGRKTFSLCKLWKASDELLPSGLLGPVRFIYERERQ